MVHPVLNEDWSYIGSKFNLTYKSPSQKKNAPVPKMVLGFIYVIYPFK